MCEQKYVPVDEIRSCIKLKGKEWSLMQHSPKKKPAIPTSWGGLHILSEDCV